MVKKNRPRRVAVLAQPGQAVEYDGNDTKTFYLPEIGFRHHLGNRLAWGFSSYGNGGLDTDYKSNPYASFSQSPGEVSDRGAAHSTGVGARLGWLGRIGDKVTYQLLKRSSTSLRPAWCKRT